MTKKSKILENFSLFDRYRFRMLITKNVFKNEKIVFVMAHMPWEPRSTSPAVIPPCQPSRDYSWVWLGGSHQSRSKRPAVIPPCQPSRDYSWVFSGEPLITGPAACWLPTRRLHPQLEQEKWFTKNFDNLKIFEKLWLKNAIKMNLGDLLQKFFWTFLL